MQTQKTQLIQFGHSPDPDDAFMFYALAKEKIPMRGFRVGHVIEDIETLNQRALQQGPFAQTPLLEVTAVSCHAYAFMADRYLVMKSGASVGDKYGPILVAKKGVREGGSPSDFSGKKIAVPGKLTTAYLVLQLYTSGFIPVFTPFDQIFEAVLEGRADYGLVIHEGQITYTQRGLQKVIDLGQWWHQKTALPLPLGVDVIRRDLGSETIRSFAALFKESIEFALANRKDALAYALDYGRGISENLNDEFVGMYVNDFTVNLGERGMKGFERLLEEGYRKGVLPNRIKLEFV